jgi:parallel beta-helix repeat protein
MTGSRIIGKIFGILIAFLIVGAMLGWLPSINDNFGVEASDGSAITYTVYATREGCVGGTTANGHVIVSHDHFVALPSTRVLCGNGGHEYEVKVTYNGKSVIAPVWDVGPWNTKDDYWNPSSEREMWQDLPQGKPEAHAAYQDGYNGGFDETNYLVKVSTGSDEFSVGDRVRPTVSGLSVRSTAGGDKIGSISTSDTGTVIDGPQKAMLNGLYYRWWNITWDKGLSGWSAQKRYVSNPAGIDLADGTFWDDLGMTDNDWVTVEFLWTTAEDTIPPTVNDFSVTPHSVSLGNAFAITYTVSDTGGSGLNRVELWRRSETVDWQEIKRTSISGDTYSGSFTDAPPSIGAYWYGIHVVDNAGNWNDERNSHTGGSPGVFGPIEVEVIGPNQLPQLSNGYVDPPSGTPPTDFYYYITYFDPDGDNPSVRQVFIDGIAYTMDWYQGLNSHITYRFGPMNLSAGGTHYYFFYFEDGRGGSARLPSGIDMYLGPTISQANNPPNVPSNPSPPNNATAVPLNIDLSWSGGDPDVGDTVTYDVYFGTSTSPLLVLDDQLGTTYDPGTLAYNTTCYWKIVATDSHGATTEGPLWDFTTQSESAPNIIYVDDDLADYPDADFTKIQEAVDAASPGDTIIVYPGTYIENVDVNKDHLTIQSENGAEATIVQVATPDDHVFEVTADYVTISGFTVEGGTGPHISGIYLYSANHCNIFDNIASNNDLGGIELKQSSSNNMTNNVASNNGSVGIQLSGSSNNSLICNIASNNGWGGIRLESSLSNILTSNAASNNYSTGIILQWSSNNTLVSNTVASNNHWGIVLHWSSNNTLISNTMVNNFYNFDVLGDNLPHFTQDIDTSNRVNGEPIQYLIDKQDIVIDSSWSAGYLGIVNCNNITVKDLDLSNNGQGLLLAHSTNCKIENVSVSNNYFGIHVDNSSNNALINNIASANVVGIYLWVFSDSALTSNTILNNDYGIESVYGFNNTFTSNIVFNNSEYGIRFGYGSDNIVYLNNLIDNADNVSSDSTNTWHSPEEITYTYSGNTYTKYLGNYWSDYGAYCPPVGHNDPDDQWENEPLAYDENRDTFARVYLGGGRDSSWLELLAPAGKLTQGIRFWGSGGPIEVDIYYDGNWYCLRDWAWGISSAPANEWVELTYPSKIVEKARIKFHGRVLSGWSYLNEFQFKTAPADYFASDADGDGIGDTPYPIDSDRDDYPLMEPLENYEIVEDTTPPTISSFSPHDNAADVAVDTVITAIFSEAMDASTITTDSFTLSGSPVSGTVTYNPATYTATFTPDANLEYNHEYIATLSTDIKDLAGNPLAKAYSWSFITTQIPQPYIQDIVPPSGVPGDVITLIGENFGYKDTTAYKVHFGLSLADITSWADNEIIVEAPSDYGLGIDAAKDAFTLISLGMSAASESIFKFGLNLLCAFIPDLKLVVLELDENEPLPQQWLKIAFAIGFPAGAVDIRPSGELDMLVTVETPVGESNIFVFTFDCADVDPIDIEDSLIASLASPGELRLYDLEGRVTGLIGGIIKEEIPGSSYLNGTIQIMNPTNAYRYEVVGTNTGVYGLNVALLQNAEVNTFAATNIPTSTGAIHQYTIDWDALSREEEGVAVRMDSDGDGEFERTFTADSELTYDEFMLQTAPPAPAPTPGGVVFLPTISNLTITPAEGTVAEVRKGEIFTIAVEVENKGDGPGSYTVTLKVNEVVKEKKTVTLAAYEKKTVTFTVTEDEAGIYKVEVNGLKGEFIVTEPLPLESAIFEVTNLGISPVEVKTGEIVTISVLVTNTGNLAGSYEVTLKINDVVEATSEVTLDAVASESVTFTVSREEADSYSVLIDGLSGSFTVAAPDSSQPAAPKDTSPEAEHSVNWPVLGGVIAGVVIIGLLIFVVRRRVA